MRKSLYIIITSIAILLFISCEKDETKVILKDTVNAPVIKSGLADGQSLVLNKDDAAKEMTVEISPVDYGFKASVTYNLLVDLEGNNFSKAQSFASSNTSNVIPVLVSKLNNTLLKFETDKKNPVPLNFEIKVQASLTGTAIEPVTSNTIKMNIAPYVP